MPDRKRRCTGGYVALLAVLLAASAGCGAKKTEQTPAGITMTPAQMQQNVDQINADPSLTPGQKELKIQMLKTHVTVAK